MDDTQRIKTTKPAQFRLPVWAQDFLVEESESRDLTRTDVVLEALAEYKHRRLEADLEAGYRACASDTLAEVQEWDATLLDGLEREW